MLFDSGAVTVAYDLDERCIRGRFPALNELRRVGVSADIDFGLIGCERGGFYPSLRDLDGVVIAQQLNDGRVGIDGAGLVNGQAV